MIVEKRLAIFIALVKEVLETTISPILNITLEWRHTLLLSLQLNQSLLLDTIEVGCLVSEGRDDGRYCLRLLLLNMHLVDEHLLGVFKLFNVLSSVRTLALRVPYLPHLRHNERVLELLVAKIEATNDDFETIRLLEDLCICDGFFGPRWRIEHD